MEREGRKGKGRGGEGLEVLGRILALQGEGGKEEEGVLERVLELEGGVEEMEVEGPGEEQIQQLEKLQQPQPQLQQPQPQYQQQQQQQQQEQQQQQSHHSAKALISSIREQEYGFPPSSSSPSSSSSSPSSSARLGRAIKRLSEELYSSHIHFIEELIQNADDNMYFEGVTPSLVVAVWDRCVVIYNNERGFQEENVRGKIFLLIFFFSFNIH